MIYCEHCGKQLKDGAAFCAECGHKVKTASPGRPSDSASGKKPAAGASAQPPAPKNRKIAIIAGACAAAVIVIAVIAFAIAGANPISNDQLRNDVNASDFATAGVVPSNYVNESPYEITDFKVDDQQKSTENLFGAELECVTATFTGTLSNANFETEFTGEANYVKENGEWVLFADPSITSSTTTPLKGVDFIDTTAESSDSAIVYSTSDFASTLDGGEGSYTSTATQKVSYDMWFATDTATSTATFAFSEDEGWQMQGEAQLSDQATEWKLAGKTFEMQPSSYGNMFERNSTSTLTFTDSDSADSLSAQWAFTFAAPQSSSEYEVLTSLDLGGTATGSPAHEFGEGSFSVTLADAANGNATFECSSDVTFLSSGDATANSLAVNVSTDDVWREWTGTVVYGDGKTRVEISSASFNEQA